LQRLKSERWASTLSADRVRPLRHHKSYHASKSARFSREVTSTPRSRMTESVHRRAHDEQAGSWEQHSAAELQGTSQAKRRRALPEGYHAEG